MSKKLITEDFIAKAKGAHGDRYDYSKVNYVNAKTKIKIICSVHGEFEQTSHKHLTGSGCAKCGIESMVNKRKLTTNDFIIKAREVHGDRYDYSKVNYVNAKTKIKIICPVHGEFEQIPDSHTNKGNHCDKCGGSAKLTTEDFIIKAREVHGDRYDYSKVNYVDNKTKIKIICPVHGEFEQTSSKHLISRGCPLCGGSTKLTTEDFIIKAREVHGDRYDYSKVKYINSHAKIKIICSVHGEFEQTPSSHLSGSGCPTCNCGITNSYKLNLINILEDSDLFEMDPFELMTIIGQGSLPQEFTTFLNTDAGTQDRLISIQELKTNLENEQEDDTTENPIGEPIPTVNDIIERELIQNDDIDNPVTTEEPERTLPTLNNINILHSLDRTIYASMDSEAFESLVQYKMRKLWNQVLNGDVDIKQLKKEKGGKYFTQIKNEFFNEYNEVIKIKPKAGYKFKHQPNLMQQLTVSRLLKNKSYGNWSGTGAGKTLSFILASRELDARLTVVIALNSIIENTCKNILAVYPNSKVFTEYHKSQVFDRKHHNYLVLNYEKFQQGYSEKLYQDLTKNNQIDFVVIDEVQNVKQRTVEEESLRRMTLTRILERARKYNANMHVLAMSATPVVNNLTEAKSLLSLMTGLEYDDLETRRTLGNAFKMFQQLLINGLRYLPKYDIEINELTGNNMSNLNIDGAHLLEKLMNIQTANVVGFEKLLIDDKLTAIKPYLRKGVIVYTQYTTGFISKIKHYIESCGYKVATYTGDEGTYTREENLRNFINGDIDVLLGSKPIGTGVDGLQGVCNRMILLTLPWTDSEYTQLKGRIYRQGSVFNKVEIVIPQVRILTGEDEYWSWDVQRLNIIKNKRTLSDAAVDGLVPSSSIPSPETLLRKSVDALREVKKRIKKGQIVEWNRSKINIELYPEINDEETRYKHILAELSEFNRRGKTTKSSTMHKEFTGNPDSWFRYHKLRRESVNSWDEIPYEYIATKIKNRNHVVVDFGCGENLMRTKIPQNKVISFDHVAIDDSVIACDMKDISQYVKDESVDVAVFSLALWGTNYRDYIKEAYRVLNYGGVIHIAEPAKDYETAEDEKKLVKLITNVGFKVIGDVEKRGKFIYITGFKE